MNERLLGILTAFVMILGFMMTGDETNCYAAEMTDLTCGQKITDFLESSDDVNCYLYTIDKSGYFTLNFTRGDPALDPGRGWDMELYDSVGNMLAEYSGIKTDFITPKLNFKQGTPIYIKILPNWKSDAPIDRIYCLQVYSVANANWEVETRKSSSDSWVSRITDASELTAANCYGSLWTPADEDVYKLSVPKTGVATLKFNPNNKMDTIGWGYDVEIYKKNGDKVMVFKQLKTFAAKQFYVKEGTYYVVVKADWVNDAPSAYGGYAISSKVKSATVPSMRSKKISYVSKTSTLKWKKVKCVDGYEIQFCKNKKFGKKNTIVYTTVESSYRLNRNLIKGNYFVRVRAYADTLTGNRFYGKFTKVKKIKKKVRIKEN